MFASDIRVTCIRVVGGRFQDQPVDCNPEHPDRRRASTATPACALRVMQDEAMGAMESGLQGTMTPQEGSFDARLERCTGHLIAK